jgi:hypothetical protein
MRRTAQRQLRAYVFVSNGKIEVATTVDGRKYVQAFISFKNFGQTPGNEFRTRAKAEIQAVSFMPDHESKPGEDRSIIGPTAGADVNVVFGPVSEEILTEVRTGTKRIFVWGRLDYIDVFGQPRYLQFREENGRLRADGISWPIQPLGKYEAN